MAITIRTPEQSLTEIRTWFVDFVDDLPEGVSVSDGSATHIPPAGGTEVPPSVLVQGSQVWATLGPLVEVGNHQLLVLADYSDGEKSEVKLIIPVSF